MQTANARKNPMCTHVKDGRTILAIDSAGIARESYRAIGRKVDGGYWCVPSHIYRSMKRATSDTVEEALRHRHAVHIIPSN